MYFLSKTNQKKGTFGHFKSYHFVGVKCLCGIDRPLQAGPADVQVLRVAVLRQEFQERADIQVVIIINVAEPPATDDTVQSKQLFLFMGCSVWCGADTHFFPELRKVSYSRAILQERA